MPRRIAFKGIAEIAIVKSHQLKLTVKRLLTAVAILTVVLCLATIALIHTLLDGQSAPVTGKNYTIDTSQAP